MPTVTPIAENWHAGGFLVSEARGHLSREAITVASGADVLAGTVLGKTLTGGTAAAAAASGNTGNGTMGAITVTGPAKVGAYKLLMVAAATNAGTFEVEDPDGLLIGSGNVATA